MSETQAASSPAEVVDPFNGGQPTASEMHEYVLSGRQEVPARFKPAEPAESATADAPVETEKAEGENPEPAPESDPEEDQELKPKTAKRIQQLLAEKKATAAENAELRRLLAEKQDAKPDSSPAKVQPQQPIQAANYDAWETKFIAEEASKWVEQWGKENPDKSYESANAAMFRHMRSVERQFEQQRVTQQKFAARNDEARQRFGEEFDSVIVPMFEAFRSNPEIHDALKEEVANSEFLPDLMDKFAKDAKVRDKFLALAKSEPITAIKYIGVLEDALSSARTRNEKGQFTAKAGNEQAAPETKKTSAPKPPSPVGGGSARVFDVNDDSIPVDEWLKGRNAQVARQR